MHEIIVNGIYLYYVYMYEELNGSILTFKTNSALIFFFKHGVVLHFINCLNIKIMTLVVYGLPLYKYVRYSYLVLIILIHWG